MKAHKKKVQLVSWNTMNKENQKTTTGLSLTLFTLLLQRLLKQNKHSTGYVTWGIFKGSKEREEKAFPHCNNRGFWRKEDLPKKLMIEKINS